MIQKRWTLWIMLFTGVVVHMLGYSNLNIAITKMVKLKLHASNATFVAQCRLNTPGSAFEEVQQTPTGEYDWSNEEKSVLLGSFSWCMGVAQLIGALLCQKYGGKIVFGISNLSLGALSLLIPAAADFGVVPVIAIRAVQGILGGGALGVSANALISKWVPPDERAKFLAIMSGMYFGTSFSYFFNGWILHFFGWRCVFYLTGAISICWCVAWYLVVYETPREDPTISSAELMYIEKSLGNSLSIKKLPVPWLAIATSVPVIVNTVIGISTVWTVFTYMLYIPTYLQEIHGFQSFEIGEFSSLPYFLETAFAIVFAAFTDMLLGRKALSVTNIRKLATFVSSIVSGILFGCLIFGGCDITLILALMTLAVMFNGASVAGGSANVVDMSPNFCAVILGLQGVVTTSTGYLSPLVVGFLTNKNSNVEQWNKVFLLTSAVNIVPAFLFFIFGDSKVQPWNFEVNGEPEKTDPELIENNENGGQMSLEA